MNEIEFNTMKFSSLKTAVIYTIEQLLKKSNTIQCYDITRFLRSKLDDNIIKIHNLSKMKMWWQPTVTGNGFHDIIRKQLNLIYNNNELNYLGFVKRTFNGTCLEYHFDNKLRDNNIPPISPLLFS